MGSRHSKPSKTSNEIEASAKIAAGYATFAVEKVLHEPAPEPVLEPKPSVRKRDSIITLADDDVIKDWIYYSQFLPPEERCSLPTKRPTSTEQPSSSSSSSSCSTSPPPTPPFPTPEPPKVTKVTTSNPSPLPTPPSPPRPPKPAKHPEKTKAQAKTHALPTPTPQRYARSRRNDMYFPQGIPLRDVAAATDRVGEDVGEAEGVGEMRVRFVLGGEEGRGGRGGDVGLGIDREERCDTPVQWSEGDASEVGTVIVGEVEEGLELERCVGRSDGGVEGDVVKWRASFVRGSDALGEEESRKVPWKGVLGKTRRSKGGGEVAQSK